MYKVSACMMLCVYSLNGMHLSLQVKPGMPSRVRPLLQGVVRYHPRYEKALKPLALSQIGKLVTWYAVTGANREELVESQVVYALQSAGIQKKVMLVKGKPVGFITYSVDQPWYAPLMPIKMNPQATIHHLLVAAAHQKKGLGKALVQSMLTDCKNSSVSVVKLWANDDDKLDRFYRKLGFKRGRETKLHETAYSLRLLPHPLEQSFKKIVEHLKP